MPVKNSDTVSAEIIELHDTYGLSFRQIAALPSWRGIPAGTICSIYNGERVPNKHRRKLGMPRLVKVPETMVRKRAPNGSARPRPRRVAVHTTDVNSAADTLMNNFETGFLKQVMIELEERMKE